MRIAYFIMAHHKPRQLEWLLEAIWDPRDLFLLHVDAKSLLGLKPERRGTLAAARRLAARWPNVRLMRPRFTNWGGWSLSRLQLDAIGRLLDADPGWTHFVNLSGQCYPIKPMPEIRRRLAESGETAFVELRHFSTLPPDDWHLRWHPMLELPHRALILRGRRAPPTDFELEHKGSQWCILPRAFCEWQRTAPVRARIGRYLRGLLLSDELVVQTLLRNGPWRDRVAPHYGREIVWPGPKLMTAADLPRLLASPGLFARKFDAAADDAVLHGLAEACGLRRPPSPAARHRPRAPMPRRPRPEPGSERPMRVALIDPSLFTLPYDRMLALGLQSIGHQVVLYGRRPGPEDGDAAGIDLAPDFYPLAHGRLGAALPRPLRLALKGLDHLVSMLSLRRRLARAEARPDVLHFQWLPLPVLDSRLLGGFRAIAPLVLTVHDSNPFNGDPAARLQGVGAAAGFAAFDRLIVHTAQGRARLLAHGVPEARIALLPHGLLGDPAPPAPPPPAPEAGAAAETTFLLFGKIKPYKGLDLLIEAFSRLPAPLRAAARLRVVGKPYMDLAPLLALARERGVADRLALEPRFVADAEVPALFGPGTVAVFPYREIEASGVLALAIAHGRPVIASRLGGFAETLREDEHGLLVPPGDVGALAGALARMAGDAAFAARCAARMRDLARAVPGWEEIARRTAAVYAEAAASRAGLPATAPLAPACPPVRGP